jgi:hypothetical protein
MSYDNLSYVSQNVLKFYQQLTGEEKMVPFIVMNKSKDDTDGTDDNKIIIKRTFKQTRGPK